MLNEKEKFVRVAVCTPTRESVHGSYAYDLVTMLKKSPLDTLYLVAFGAIIGNVRAKLVNEAGSKFISHYLFIDSDMRFPPDTIERLLAHDKDIIAANCKQRARDEWTATRDNKFVSSTGKKGIEKIDSVGFGVMLIKVGVFLDINPPWFASPFDGEKLIGEDNFFCTMARRAKREVWIDHDLSQEIKHIGSVELGVN